MIRQWLQRYEWLWQGLITEWLAPVILAVLVFAGLCVWQWLSPIVRADWFILAVSVGAGLVLSCLHKKHPDLVKAVSYGLAASCFVIVTFWAFKSLPVFSKETPQVNADNVETHIKTWLESYGYGIRINADNVETHIKTWLESYGYGIRKITFPDTHFAYEIKPNDNSAFILMRHQSQRGDYLNLQAVIDVPPQLRAVLAMVQGEQLARLTHEFFLEIAKARVNGWLEPRDKLERVWLTRRFPINNLTEESFMQQIHEIDAAIKIVQAAMIVAVDQAMTYKPPVSPPKR